MSLWVSMRIVLLWTRVTSASETLLRFFRPGAWARRVAAASAAAPRSRTDRFMWRWLPEELEYELYVARLAEAQSRRAAAVAGVADQAEGAGVERHGGVGVV